MPVSPGAGTPSPYWRKPAYNAQCGGNVIIKKTRKGKNILDVPITLNAGS